MSPQLRLFQFHSSGNVAVAMKLFTMHLLCSIGFFWTLLLFPYPGTEG